MTLKLPIVTASLLLGSALLLSSCYTEDPGPIQEYEKEYNVVDFDRLEMGDAFKITVEQGSLFEVKVSGDRRNIDDLIVEKEGSTLVVRYEENRNRRHNTEIEITMPSLTGVNFSGASDSKVRGFEDSVELDVTLSGASTCQLDVVAAEINLVVSGASYLYLYGEGDSMTANISGASVMKAFHYPVAHAALTVSGASDGNVSVSEDLEAVASGASVITYRGNPTVTSQVSGASTVRQD